MYTIQETMRRSKLKLREFDISAYLDDEKTIAGYLAAVLEVGNQDDFLAALGDVLKARGMTTVAAATGLGRESLYKSFARGGNPQHDTTQKVLHSLGLTLTVVPRAPMEKPQITDTPQPLR